MDIISFSSNDKPAVQPVLLACLSCRRKHLKCDGGSPCKRCASLLLECSYQASRRGYKGPQKKRRLSSTEILEAPLQTETPSIADDCLSTPGLPSRQDWQPTCDDSPTVFNEDLGDFNVILSGQTIYGETQYLPQLEVKSPSTQNIDCYYTNFHPSHPILLPRHVQREHGPPDPCLLAVMDFIGCHYTSKGDDSLCESYKHNVKTLLELSVPSVSIVQTQLLLAIVLHVRNELEEATLAIHAALDSAIKLGMHKARFAKEQGDGHLVVEESLRRTWWEIYVVSCMFAAFHQDLSILKATQIPSNVYLPREDWSFVDEDVPSPLTMNEFRDRAFLDEHVEFSSYCYRIEAAELLSRAISVKPTATTETVESVDAALASWVHHLPDDKRDVLNKGGKVDELLFQAHMLINCALVFLHLPRSLLLSSPINSSTTNISCAKRNPASLPASSEHTHAMKTIKAANKLSTLAALDVSADSHTPLFICACVLDAVVQLSACSIQVCDCIEQHRDRITLAIGILKTLSSTWSIASRAMQQIKAVARSVLAIGVKSPRYTMQSNELDFDSIINDNDLLGLTSDIEQPGSIFSLDISSS